MLSPDNYLVYAMNHYENVFCSSLLDFQNDLNISVYIRRWFRRFKKNGNVKERLLLNHFITFFNVFENHAAVNILFFILDEDLYSELKTVLVFLNRLPEQIEADKFIETDKIAINNKLLKKLEAL